MCKCEWSREAAYTYDYWELLNKTCLPVLCCCAVKSYQWYVLILENCVLYWENIDLFNKISERQHKIYLGFSLHFACLFYEIPVCTFKIIEALPKMLPLVIFNVYYANRQWPENTVVINIEKKYLLSIIQQTLKFALFTSTIIYYQ